MFEKSFETGRIFAMKGSRWVLAEGVLFRLRGCGHAHGHAMPNFILDSKSSVLGLSNEVSFVSKYFWKKGENWGKKSLLYDWTLATDADCIYQKLFPNRILSLFAMNFSGFHRQFTRNHDSVLDHTY